MKSIKHIMALCLSLVMIFSVIIPSGVITASAVAGAGIQKTSFRSYGIDISYWNVAVGNTLDYSRVDFAKLKADGCQFVILRIGYEGSASRQDTIDDTFLEYYRRARAAGMPMGVYFYALATTKAGAAADAQWVIDVIEKNNMYFEYPIYYDIEAEAHMSLSSSGMEQLCLGWCETLEAAGYFPGIYGGGSQVIDKLSSSFKTKYDLWYARYKSNYEGNQHAANAYDFSDYCGMWQHAIFGYYDGLATSSVDMNVCYKDYPAIMKQYGYNNCIPDKPAYEGKNIALNKNYEAGTYGSYTANLTDGKATTNLSYDANWFAFYNNGSANATNAPNKVGTVVIDLNGRFDINGININAVQNQTSGVGIPTSVKAYLSKDGKNWGAATTLTVPELAKTTTGIAFGINGEVDGTASYVKLEFALGEKSFVFLNEIEVYGEETTADDPSDEPSEDPSEDPSEYENLAKDKDYTTFPNRNDAWDDDGLRLTDGKKGQTQVNILDPETSKPYYSGWTADDATEDFSVEILLDLETAQEANSYTAYLAGGNWGIALPKDNVSMEVYVSDNADSGFELVASAPVGSAKLTNGTGANDDTWSLYTLTAATNKSVSARYVKFVLTHKGIESEDGKSYIWIDEVEVFNSDEVNLIGKVNVALDKDYKGGDVSPAGPNYSANLTDGNANTTGAFDSTWYAFYYNKDATADKITAPNGLGEVVIDLNEVVDGITDVRVNVWNCNANGILPAKSITLFVSEDGNTYTEIGELDIPDGNDPAWATISTDYLSAQYVKLVVETQAVWTFLNEVEVYVDPNYVPEDDGDVSEPEVSEPDVSEPEVSEPDVSEPEISEPEVSEPVDSNNVALGKDYEADEYGSYTANLTDGVAAQAMAYNNTWFAFYNNKDSETNAPNKVGTVVIDLDGSFVISGVKINAVQNVTSGVGMPNAIKVYLSDDGETWGEAFELGIPDIADTTTDVAFAIEGLVDGTASFVKFEFVLGEKSFVFFNEIEVYGEEAKDDDVSEPEVSEPEVSEPEVSEPEVSEPEVSEPEVSEPEVSEPEVSDPDVSEPGDGEGDGDGDTEKGELGDVDFDGDVDAADYILVKRSVLRTYKLTDKQFAVADIDADGDVDAADYVLVKRIVLGTYIVKQ